MNSSYSKTISCYRLAGLLRAAAERLEEKGDLNAALEAQAMSAYIFDHGINLDDGYLVVGVK